MERLRFVLISLPLLWAIPDTGFSQSESEKQLCLQTFGYAYEAASMATQAVWTGAEAVWGASELNGGTPTFTGTLTESTVNPDQWTYSPTPNDRLVVQFAHEPAVEFAFAAFNGSTSGTYEDFCYSHTQLDFTASIQGAVNFHIQSQSGWDADTVKWTRSITGDCKFYNAWMNTNLVHSGKLRYELGSGFAFYYYWEQFVGNASSSVAAVTINEGSYVAIAHNSNTAVHLRNDEKWNSSSAVLNSVTYQYEGAHTRWARGSALTDPGAFNVVEDANYWLAEGTMTRNGQPWGEIRFNGDVIEGTEGPDLVLHLVSGEDVVIHPIIGTLSTAAENYEVLPSRVQLEQNFPNPFNPGTAISYELTAVSDVTLRVYDIQGRVVATLVNGREQPGTHMVRLDGSGLSSGVYFYRLTVGNSSQSKKMILVR